MIREIIKPTQNNAIFPITMPSEWFGMTVEVIAFPLNVPISVPDFNAGLIKERRKRRENMLKKYKFSSKNFKFDRNEANNYE